MPNMRLSKRSYRGLEPNTYKYGALFYACHSCALMANLFLKYLFHDQRLRKKEYPCQKINKCQRKRCRFLKFSMCIFSATLLVWSMNSSSFPKTLVNLGQRRKVKGSDGATCKKIFLQSGLRCLSSSSCCVHKSSAALATHGGQTICHASSTFKVTEWWLWCLR